MRMLLLTMTRFRRDRPSRADVQFYSTVRHWGTVHPPSATSGRTRGARAYLDAAAAAPGLKEECPILLRGGPRGYDYSRAIK
jgi:hypothetical protein